MTHGPMKPANILFVHGNNDLYGADAFLLEIVKRLDRARFYPIVVLPTDVRHINRLSVELESNGVEYRFIRMGVMRRRYFKPFRILQYLAELLIGIVSLAFLIRRRNVAAVHSNTSAVTAGAFAAFLTRTPHLWHVHEILVEPVRLRRAMHWLVPRMSQVVLCVSNAVRDHIAADQPSQAHKLLVIYNGIDVDRFAPAARPMRVRDEFGIDGDAPLVGMVGKVCRWKGQIVFAAAARHVLARFPQARFLAVGGVFDKERHYMDQFRAEVARLDMSNVFHIVDFRKDVRDVMNSCDVFVLPSTLPDPCPSVVLEAMAAGKPVIATAHGGPVEQVVDGQTGYLVRPGDAEDLAAAICKLLADPVAIRNMGQEGRRRAYQHFTISRFMRDVEGVYGDLCGFVPCVLNPESGARENTQVRL